MHVSDRAKARSRRNLIGLRVCKARSEHSDKLTQDQLAGRLAVEGVVLDRVTIAKIETGQRCVYDFEVVAFARALGVDPLWLLGVKGDANGKTRKNRLRE